jgi:hypothetical protein
MSVQGAEQIRHKLKAQLVKGDVASGRYGPGGLAQPAFSQSESLR